MEKSYLNTEGADTATLKNNERLNLDKDVKEAQAETDLVGSPTKKKKEEDDQQKDPQRFKRAMEDPSHPWLQNFHDGASRVANDIHLKYQTYAKPIKNVESDLIQYRLIDSPLKDGGQGNDKQFEKYMQKELDKRFDVNHAKSLLLDNPHNKKPADGTTTKREPVKNSGILNDQEESFMIGTKGLKKDVEKLKFNLINDQRRVTSDGKTQQEIMKKINEGHNVETVKKVICEGTALESIMTDKLTKEIVNYFQNNKLGGVGKIPAHEKATYTISSDVEQGIFTILQSVIKADSFLKKQNPFDKIVETGTKRQRDLNALQKIGLDNENEHTYSKIGAHEVWFNERKDRKLDATFKDNTTRYESHVYNRFNPLKSEKFADGSEKMIRPRVREADFGKKPKTIPRETKPAKSWCHTKGDFPRCVYELYEETKDKDKKGSKNKTNQPMDIKQDPSSPDPRAKRSVLRPKQFDVTQKLRREQMAELRQAEYEKKHPKPAGAQDPDQSAEHEMRLARLADENIPILWKVPEWQQERVAPIDPTGAIQKRIIAPIEFSKQTAKTDIIDTAQNVNEKRFEYAEINTKITKHSDEIVYKQDRAQKPQSFFWPKRRDLDPFYVGTGREKFYKTEQKEVTIPSLHTGFVQMNNMKGRDDIEHRNKHLDKKEGERLQYEPDLIRNGQHMLSTFKQGPAIVPFHSMQARPDFGDSKSTKDASLNKTMMGSTNMSQVSLGQKSGRCNTEANVSFVDYLPNSIVRSPQKRAFSHSNTTQRLNINKVVRTNVLVQPVIPGEHDREGARSRGKKGVEGGELQDIMERKKLNLVNLTSSFDGGSVKSGRFDVIRSQMSVTNEALISNRGDYNNYTSMPRGIDINSVQKSGKLSLMNAPGLNMAIASTKASDYSKQLTKRTYSPTKIDTSLGNSQQQFNSVTYAKGRSLGKHSFFPEKIAL